MAVERYGSKTDVVVKLVLVFFIALLSFSIGTFVGKKFSDNQHKLAQLEPNEHSTEVASGGGHGETATHGDERGVASVHPDAGDVKPEKALTDDEIAKLAEEFVTDDEAADPGKLNDKNAGGHTTAHNEHGAPPADAHAAPAHGEEPAHDAHAAPAAHKPASVKAPVHAESPKKDKAPPAPHHGDHGAPAANSEALKPAKRMAEGHSAVIDNPTHQASRIPSALPKEVASSAIGKFTVQVASYGTEKEAQTQAADLKGKGFSAFYVSAKVKGATWYRVNVGLFTTQKEADSYKKDLLARAKISSAIVQKVASAE